MGCILTGYYRTQVLEAIDKTLGFPTEYEIKSLLL